MHYSRKDLLARIKKVAKTGCWEFQGPRDAYGFGRMYSGNKEFKAHKVFYETWNGELSPGNYLHHIRYKVHVDNLNQFIIFQVGRNKVIVIQAQ